MTWFKNQLVPIILALVIFFILALLYFAQINILNLFSDNKILLQVFIPDVLVGLTIYLKTSVDFALLIGLLMKQYPGLKNRIAIETGTAAGNALGTMVVLAIWFFFKEIQWLLGLMVVFASLVLLKLAETSFEHAFESEEDGSNQEKTGPLQTLARPIYNILQKINHFLSPVMDKVVPDLSFKTSTNMTIWGLLASSFTIPFILGIDDFAGYVPLFNVVNVFGFGLGVFLGHAILNILLFLNPVKTVQIVKNPIIAVIGGFAFIGLSLWGLWEAAHVLSHYFVH